MTETAADDTRARWVVLGTVAIAVLSGLVFAVAATHGQYDSTTGAAIRPLYRTLLAVGLPAAILIEGALLYAVLRFRDRATATPVTESRRLEVGWTLGTGVVLVVVGLLSLQVMLSPAVGGPAQATPGSESGGIIVVNIVAEQWDWTAHYPASNTTSDRVYVPANRSVVFRLTSRDVVHSFSVPALGLKRDVFPGQYTSIRTTATRPGEYRLVCAEFCGAGHSRMVATVEVLPQSAYAAQMRTDQSANRSQDRTGGV